MPLRFCYSNFSGVFISSFSCVAKCIGFLCVLFDSVKCNRVDKCNTMLYTKAIVHFPCNVWAYPLLRLWLKAFTQYANAIKTPNDISPTFQTFCYFNPFWLLLTLIPRLFVQIFFLVYLFTLSLLLFSLRLSPVLCIRIFTHITCHFCIPRTPFIIANEFSSAVSQISSFFLFVCYIIRSMQTFCQ